MSATKQETLGEALRSIIHHVGEAGDTTAHALLMAWKGQEKEIVAAHFRRTRAEVTGILEHLSKVQSAVMDGDLKKAQALFKEKFSVTIPKE